MPIDMNTRQPGQDIGQDASIMDFLRAMGQDAGAVGSKIGGLFTGGGRPVAARGIQADPAAVANKSMRPQMQTPPVGASVPPPAAVNSAELPPIKPPTAAPPQQVAATPPNVPPNPRRPSMPPDIATMMRTKTPMPSGNDPRMSPLLALFQKIIGAQSGR